MSGRQCYSERSLARAAAKRRPGFVDALVAGGLAPDGSGRLQCLDASVHARIVREYPADARGSLERPGVANKAGRLGGALVRWVRAGFGLAEKRERARRKAACETCELWRPRGNLGLGECQAPGCGCTRLKRYLPTERCPLGKWPA